LYLAALAALGFVAAVLLARLLPFHEWGHVAYFGGLAVAALALAVVYRFAGRRDPLMSLIVGLGVIVTVLVVDVVFGAPLQLSNPLGYSPLIAARFSGFGNLGYAALASSAVLLAGLLAHRIGGRRGALFAIAMLAVVFVADGAPMWGSDVGGILSMLPAFAATGYLLLGYRIRLRTAVLGLVAAVIALVAFGLFDLTRPSDKRTHLGRLFETTESRGWSGFWTVIERKIYENLSVLFRSTWLLVVLAVLGFLAYVYSRRRERLRAIVEWVPELRASFVGFAIVATLGFAVNDSGIAIPGMMLSVLNATVVALMVGTRRRVAPPEATPAAAEPAPPVVTRT
jgi:MFS family permease